MAGSTILVVDGDPASRNYIATALQKQGYRVLQAGSGKDALISAWRDQPDVVVAKPCLSALQGEDFARQSEQRLGIPMRTSIPYLAGNFSLANNQHQPYIQKFPPDTASIALKDTAWLMIEAARQVRAG